MPGGFGWRTPVRVKGVLEADRHEGCSHVDGLFVHNLTSVMGRGQPNLPDDVQFVQFGFYCRQFDKSTGDTLDEQALYSNVKRGAPFAGQAGDPLSVAIVLLQKTHGGTKDGIVGPLSPGLAVTYGHGQWLFLTRLLGSIYVVTKGKWPRIDRHSMCPAAVRTAVRDVICKLPV